jgi:hypothetical protein
MASVQLFLEECSAGGLPHLCARCGAKATSFHCHSFSRAPVWVYLLVPLGFFPYLIAAWITARRRTATIPLCSKHRDHWVNRGLLIATVVGPTTFLIILLLGDIFPLDVLVAILLAVVLFVGLIVLVLLIKVTTIQPSEITDDSMTLENVGQAFVDAVENRRDEPPDLHVQPPIQERWQDQSLGRDRNDKRYR